MDHVHAHLRAYLTAVAGLPGGSLGEQDGVTWCRTTIPWPMFNGVLATSDPGPAVRELVDAGLPWFQWLLPDTPAAVIAPEAREFDERAPWMEAPIDTLPDPELPDGVTIEEVGDEAGHRTWAALVREIYGFPEVGELAWTMPGELCGWTGLPWRQWIAYADGEPAAVTMLFCGGGVAGLFGVGVKSEFRRRGLGRLVTLLPLKESGEGLAGFFATEEGEPLYRALGFETRGWVTRRLGNA